MPLVFNFANRVCEIMDLPLPGKPVTQTHQPADIMNYPLDCDNYRQSIVNLLIRLRSAGYKESTLRNMGYTLRHLAKYTDLNDVEAV